jgi:aspartyl-tRNA(Asn)/glutamyl-tRNA(Gln) amidotransferase subunit B
MSYTTIVGLEVHVQLLTHTKLFCGCVNRFNPTQPNVQTCPVCLGLPGSLPVMNRHAFELALKTGLALNCEIPTLTKWDRKQYYYPDLPKGYQISQYDLAFSSNGWLDVATDPQGKELRRIGLIRAHLEEDAGKNFHDETGRGGESLVDLNRAGTPLLEIVTRPDIRSSAEAHAFLDELKLLLTYLEVSDCNMQEGSLRCDANVNVHVDADGGTIATPIVEVKNLNSFRGVELAIEHEARRQFEQWKATGKKLGEVPKETRGWDAERGVTFSQRGKEEASDYRYFPDPDLVPVTVDAQALDAARAGLGELPAAQRARLQTQYGLSPYDAGVLTSQGRAFTTYFEELTQRTGDAKEASNWINNQVLQTLNERKLTIKEFPVPAAALAELLQQRKEMGLNAQRAREVYARMLETGVSAPQAIRELGVQVVADEGQLLEIVRRAIAANPKAVADFKKGKTKAADAIKGAVMRETKGMAKTEVVQRLLLQELQKC